MLLASLASSVPAAVCFDLGTGTGGVLSSMTCEGMFRVGVDNSMDALLDFDRSAGSPVLCNVSSVPDLFREGCADLVVANPPYFSRDAGRTSPDPLRAQARTGDRLTVYRFIFAGAHLLRKGGVLLVSGRPGNRGELEQGMKAAGFTGFRYYREGGSMALKASRT